jgi:hypothetical protein
MQPMPLFSLYGKKPPLNGGWAVGHDGARAVGFTISGLAMVSVGFSCFSMDKGNIVMLAKRYQKLLVFKVKTEQHN